MSPADVREFITEFLILLGLGICCAAAILLGAWLKVRWDERRRR